MEGVAKKQVIKSAEQRMLEKATAEYAAKCASILNCKVKVTVQIDGLTYQKLTYLQSFMQDEEGEMPTLHTNGSLVNGKYFSINTDIAGEGYEIDSLSTCTR